MKLFYVTVIGLMVSTSAFAQKGSFYVGGQVGFSSSTTKVESTEVGSGSSWSFSPEFGTFLTNNVQLGVGFNVVGRTSETPNLSKSKSNSYGGTVYSRYFFGEGSKAFRPFVGVNVTALPGSEERTSFIGTTSATSKWDLFTFGANVNAGFAYALSPKVTVVGNLGVLGFESFSQKQDIANASKQTTNGFGFDLNSLGNRFNIGLYLTL